MAKETMDKVVEVGKLEDVKGCQTDGFLLEGGEGWYPTLFIQLVQDYGVDVEVRVCVGGGGVEVCLILCQILMASHHMVARATSFA